MKRRFASLAAAIGIAVLSHVPSADAGVQFDYSARVTDSSPDTGSSLLGGLHVGDVFFGRFSFDPDAARVGGPWYRSEYGFASGVATFSALLPHGTLESPLLTAYLVDAPAYPFHDNDSFEIVGSRFVSTNTGSGPLETRLGFHAPAGFGPWTGTALPRTLELSALPFSGGTITFDAGYDSERLRFQFTALTPAVPEPGTGIVVFVGLGAVALAAQRQRRHGRRQLARMH